MANYNRELGRRIYEARKKSGLTMKGLGNLVGLHESTIKRYEDGNIRQLDISKVKEFARVLNIDPIHLMGWGDEVHTISKAEKIPLLGQIAAGLPLLAEENIEDYFNIDTKIKADFALRIKGDSMINAGIYPDDIVFIRKQESLENGEVGAILIDDEATLKRFYKDNGTVILQAEKEQRNT